MEGGQGDKKLIWQEISSGEQEVLYLCLLPLLLQLEGKHPDSVGTSSCCATTERHCHLTNSRPRGEQEETPVTFLNRIWGILIGDRSKRKLPDKRLGCLALELPPHLSSMSGWPSNPAFHDFMSMIVPRAFAALEGKKYPARLMQIF